MAILINVADLVDKEDPEERTFRQINNAMIHNFNLGELVEIDDGVRMFIVKQTRDCDGTPLYCLTPFKDENPNLMGNQVVPGVGESSLIRIKDKT